MPKFKDTVCIAHDLCNDTYHVFPSESVAKDTVLEWILEEYDAPMSESKYDQAKDWTETEWKYYQGDFYNED